MGRRSKQKKKKKKKEKNTNKTDFATGGSSSLSEPGKRLIRDSDWSSTNELFTVLQREMIIITTFTIPKLSLLCSFLCSRNPLGPVIKQNVRSETNGLLGWHPSLAHEVSPGVHSVRT